MSEISGGLGMHSGYAQAIGCPVFWYNTRDWTGGPAFDTGIGLSVHVGSIVNRGSAGSYYDLPVAVTWDDSIPQWATNAFRFFYNFASPNTRGDIDDPSIAPLYPTFENYLSDTWWDDVGGLPVAGGPMAVSFLLTSMAGASSGDLGVFRMNDVDAGTVGYLGQFSSGVTFQEWLDYVNVSISNNFSEIRGPNVTPRSLLDGKLVTIWTNWDTGVGDILIDRHSIFTDPTYDGVVPGQDRGDVFWKFFDANTISPLNDPDSVWANLANPQEVLIRILGAVTNVAPVQGDSLPGVAGMAMYRGIPTPTDLDGIKTGLAGAGGTAAYCGPTV